MISSPTSACRAHRRSRVQTIAGADRAWPDRGCPFIGHEWSRSCITHAALVSLARQGAVGGVQLITRHGPVTLVRYVKFTLIRRCIADVHCDWADARPSGSVAPNPSALVLCG